MHLSFLTPPVVRLRADGSFETVHEGGLLGRLRPPVVLLARSLCAFKLFEARAIPANRRRQAARLHARVAAPYIVAGTALVKAGADFGVWWWDIEHNAGPIQARYGTKRVAVRPESLAQTPASGWRVVKLEEGYESQLWRAGDLIASAWRPSRPDAGAWAAFTRLQRGDTPAEDSPPAPQSLPIAYDSEAFSITRMEISRDQLLALAGGGFVFATLVLAAFWTGQAATLQSRTKAIAAETDAVRQAVATLPQAGDVQGDRRKLIGYRTLEEQTNPLTAAGAAVTVLALQDLSASQLSVEEDVLTLTLPYAAGRRSDQLVEEFEGSGYFYDVRPSTDAARTTYKLEMKIREDAAPLTVLE